MANSLRGTQSTSAAHRFGTYAQNYVDSELHQVGYTLEKLIGLVQPVPGKQILDLATGGGHVAQALARHGAAVIAADLAAPMLVAARANFNAAPAGSTIRFVMNNAQVLPFADASFDAVTTRLAPHHFADVSAYVQEVARVLKPNGIFALCDHVGATDSNVAKYMTAIERLRDPSHVEMLSQPAWEALFFQHGLAVTFSELVSTRTPFSKWVSLQQPMADTITRLQVLFQQAPHTVIRWLEPEMPTLGDWHFTRWDIIICGVKA